VVSKLNFTDGTSAGHLDQFSKGPQRLEWPLALQDPAYKDGRDLVTSLSADALRQAGSTGKVEYGTIRELQAVSNRLLETLKGQVDDLSPTDYIQAKRFLNDLGKSSRALGDANAAAVLAGKWKIEASTVDQLIAGMTRQGLQFAPARSGDEAAYKSAYLALRAYDTHSSQMATAPRKRQAGVSNP
jgi:hypothetical protein